MFGLLKRIISGDISVKFVDNAKKIVSVINSFEKQFSLLSDEELKEKTCIFKSSLNSGKTEDDILPEVFAVVKEVSYRVLGLKHFDVQLIGGIALHRGMIAEMKTGEGKTLVAPLAAYLNALNGKGVHIVTVNDYLAKRDSEWMGKIFTFLGMQVGCIQGNMNTEERKKEYACDVTYATNNELGFDYLKDNMQLDKSMVIQRGMEFAIIDEVDSILIDEARTPLVISGQTDTDVMVYSRIEGIMPFVTSLKLKIDEGSKNISIDESDFQQVEDLLKKFGLINNSKHIYDEENLHLIHYLEQSLRAHKLFAKDKDYIVVNGQIQIIDEFTGRVMEGRRFSEGLHQALEAKENVKIQKENKTLASTTFQNYFRLYKKLSGMTGTAFTEMEEFRNIYGMEVVKIPTNLNVARVDEQDEIYCTEEEKFEAVLSKIKECYARKQPVLVGTISIAKSEHLSFLLKNANLPHNVLNAKNHDKEAKIIAEAGKPSAITIATNMAGRGTDIKLGGIPEKFSDNDYHQNREIVIQAGGLYVIGTERHESRRIDNQLLGRSGRQGDVGRSKFFLSLEDDLLRIFGSEKVKRVFHTLGMKKGEVIIHPLITRAIEKSQKKVENHHYDIRKSLLKYDDVVNEQRILIFKQRSNILNSEEYHLESVVRNINNHITRGYISKMQNEMFCEKEELEQASELLKIEIKRIYNIDILLDENLKLEERIEAINLSTIDAINKKLLLNSSEDYHGIITRIMLITLDYLWQNHLSFLDNLKLGMGLRSMGNNNPLNEFKKEAFKELDIMLHKWQELSIQRISHLELEIVKDNNIDISNISRNDLCYCGSKKKFKHCHGKIVE